MYYHDGGDMICEECKKVCKHHFWDRKLQKWLGECCSITEKDLAEALMIASAVQQGLELPVQVELRHIVAVCNQLQEAS
jgi:hypothetical protein